MPFFTKKPVTVEAVQWIGSNPSEILAFCHGSASYDRNYSEMVIYTLEGKHTASLGDWIIRGVKGEHYPCKPDIFDATYDPTN